MNRAIGLVQRSVYIGLFSDLWGCLNRSWSVITQSRTRASPAAQPCPDRSRAYACRAPAHEAPEGEPRRNPKACDRGYAPERASGFQRQIPYQYTLAAASACRHLRKSVLRVQSRNRRKDEEKLPMVQA